MTLKVAALTASLLTTAALASPDPVMSTKCGKACSYRGKIKNAIVDQASAKIGDLVRCPVSGVVFRVTKDSKTIQSDGRTQYVCCNACLQRFKETAKKRS
jgi:hypothetical protein